jgi:hypothetical protein
MQMVYLYQKDPTISPHFSLSFDASRLRQPNRRAEDEISDDGTSEEENEPDASAVPSHRYSFPELDAKIREVVKDYGGVFPKLNWTSPRVRCTPSRVGVVLRQ